MPSIIIMIIFFFTASLSTPTTVKTVLHRLVSLLFGIHLYISRNSQRQRHHHKLNSIILISEWVTSVLDIRDEFMLIISMTYDYVAQHFLVFPCFIQNEIMFKYVHMCLYYMLRKFKATLQYNPIWLENKWYYHTAYHNTFMWCM